jgi:hypothetical protein
MIYLIVIITLLIFSIIYGQIKLNQRKRELEDITLFEDLINLGFAQTTSIKKKNDLNKWLSKKEENDEFEYHCCLYLDRNKIDFDIILELKRRVVNYNSGFFHDIKLSRRYKEKQIYLTSNSFTKFYKIKKKSDLPKAKEVINDFNEMIKILKKENIKTLTKFEN